MRGGRVFNWRAIGEAALYALLALVIVGAAVDLAVGYTRTHPHSVTTAEPADTRTRELLRCQVLGFAAERDSACLAAWADSRRHFLTYRTSHVAVASFSSSSNPSLKDE